MVNVDKTTIQISFGLRGRLIDLKRGNDTYDDVIEKLIIRAPPLTESEQKSKRTLGQIEPALPKSLADMMKEQ